MKKKDLIKALVVFALTDKTTHNKVVKLGVITAKQAELIKAKTGFNLEGYERIVDKSGINHTIKNHSNARIEAARGQIAVTEKDFELIPEIVQSNNIIFSGKNKTGKNCLLYEAKIGDTFYYVEEIRTGRKQLALQTMYKRK
ncbi:MAG: hypothetical protein RL708_1531 [Bacteroidota bacterium]|jgi:hypothetical protein